MGTSLESLDEEKDVLAPPLLVWGWGGSELLVRVLRGGFKSSTVLDFDSFELSSLPRSNLCFLGTGSSVGAGNVRLYETDFPEAIYLMIKEISFLNKSVLWARWMSLQCKGLGRWICLRISLHRGFDLPHTRSPSSRFVSSPFASDLRVFSDPNIMRQFVNNFVVWFSNYASVPSLSVFRISGVGFLSLFHLTCFNGILP